jgi:hypothetical protein
MSGVEIVTAELSPGRSHDPAAGAPTPSLMAIRIEMTNYQEDESDIQGSEYRGTIHRGRDQGRPTTSTASAR